MQHQFFRAPRLLFFIALAALALFAACAPDPTTTPTRGLTRPARYRNQPTKFARLAPTETRKPTRTPRPTRTPVPTQPSTPLPPATPVLKNVAAPTAPAAAKASNSPAIAPPTVAPTEPPTPTPGREPGTELAISSGCDPSGGGDYGLLGAGGWEGRPPEFHPDLNLSVRGYRQVSAFGGLVDYDGEVDGSAPQLWGLFADRRTPDFVHSYQVYDWDWGSDTRGELIQDFEVTMAGLRVSEGETIYTPDFGHEIGEGYVALVLYADAHRVTLKYTGEDNVVDGYTLHLEGLCVFANLLTLYNARHAAGRGAIPALRPGQPVGYAPGAELGVAIRDRGAFLDPRSRKDWWQGR